MTKKLSQPRGMFFNKFPLLGKGMYPTKNRSLSIVSLLELSERTLILPSTPSSDFGQFQKSMFLSVYVL